MLQFPYPHCLKYELANMRNQNVLKTIIVLKIILKITLYLILLDILNFAYHLKCRTF